MMLLLLMHAVVVEVVELRFLTLTCRLCAPLDCAGDGGGRRGTGGGLWGGETMMG